MKLLVVINWLWFAVVAMIAASWVAVSAMLIPYQEQLLDSDDELRTVITLTVMFLVLAIIAAGTAWLATRRHPQQRYAQWFQVLAIVLTLGIAALLWL